MEAHPTITPTLDRPRRVLAVADWDLDPHTIVAALAGREPERPSVHGLLIPAGLHGLDWAGEPNASRPCAERQLAKLKQLLDAAGLAVQVARVGDPEAGPAISDVVYDWPPDEILLFARERRLAISHPFSLVRRVERATGLAVTKIGVGRATRRRRFRSAPQCQPLRLGTVTR